MASGAWEYGSEQDEGVVESLLLGDGFLVEIEVLAGHPFLAHRKGAAAVQLLGPLRGAGPERRDSRTAGGGEVGEEKLKLSLEWRVKRMASVGMKIGALAGRSGLPVKTLRYYEDLGLLPAVGRSEGGYRLFAEESLRRLGFIRRLKTLGLSLEEIQNCLAVHDAGELPCDDIAIQLGRQIERIDGQISELIQLRTELQQLLAGWQSDPVRSSTVICPNLQV